jgi:hypothetical protein
LVADLLIGRARRFLQAGKATEAAASASRALAIREKTLAGDHPKRAEALEIQAQVLRATGTAADRQQAAALEKQARKILADHEENERAG